MNENLWKASSVYNMVVAQRDEARAVARRLYAENSGLTAERNRLAIERDYMTESYNFAFKNWQEYAQRCQDYYSEIYRLRARLQELTSRSES